ncbi:MAG: C1 family peptidase [Syntrophobacter sp.]
MSGKFQGKNKSALLLILLCVSVLLSSVPALAATQLQSLREAIRANGAQWEAGETSVSQMPEVKRKRLLGLDIGALHAAHASSPVVASPPLTGLGAISSTLDWRDSNFVTPVRDQGDCGSCWAFATTAALESQTAMKTSSLVDLSEQVLVSCGGKSSVGDCDGGYVDGASNFIRDTGLPLEDCFSYTAQNTSCSNATCPSWRTDGTYSITGWHWVTTYNPTVDAIKAALNSYGPLVTTMDVYDDFYNYISGVYKAVSKTYEGGHAVLIVGYDDTNQCFIVKNSWGTNWGESGYFRIAYTQLDNRVYFGWYTMAYEGFKSIGPSSTPTICTYSLSKNNKTVGAAGKNITVSVTADSGCDWTTTTRYRWLRFVSQSTTSGSGTFTYNVRHNLTGVTRVGVVKVAGKKAYVTQLAY